MTPQRYYRPELDVLRLCAFLLSSLYTGWTWHPLMRNTIIGDTT